MWTGILEAAEHTIARAAAEVVRAAALGLPRPEPLPSQPGSRSQVVSFPAFDRWSDHPGRQLTLRKILSAYDRADEGDPSGMCDIFDDRVEVDGHMRSQFEQREASAACKPWVILEGGGEDADREAARLLALALGDVPNLIETYDHQLRSNRFGWSGSEIDWQRRAVGGRQLIVPTWFENVAHRRFRFDDRGRLLIDVGYAKRPEPLRPGAWWVTARPGRLMSSSGLMRTACILSWIKSKAFVDWIVWSNRYGIPFVYGTYDDGADGANEDERAVLRKAVKALGTDGWAIFSKACEITIAETQKGGKSDDVHGALANFCNTEISKLVTGATQNVEMGTAGSYAQAEVHAQRAFDLVAGDAQRLSLSFHHAIARPFVQWNNLSARPPRLELRVVRDMAPTSRAKVFAIALNEIRIPLDADQVRHELQLRAPGGEVIEPPEASSPAPSSAPEPGEDVE